MRWDEMACTLNGCGDKVKARALCSKHYGRWLKYGDPRKTLIAATQRGDIANFLANMPNSGDGCIKWPFAKNNKGYAQINLMRRKFLVSRIICERVNGRAPSKTHLACHTCGKGHEACVAPWHLVWGTPRENSADLEKHGTRKHGEDCPQSKLTEEQVVQIRSMNGRMSQSKIASKFGVSQTLVGRIINRKMWKHVI